MNNIFSCLPVLRISELNAQCLDINVDVLLSLFYIIASERNIHGSFTSVPLNICHIGEEIILDTFFDSQNLFDMTLIEQD